MIEDRDDYTPGRGHPALVLVFIGSAVFWAIMLDLVLKAIS